MIDAAKAERATFEALLDETFRLSAGELSFDAALIEVAAMGETPGPEGRMAFSAIFRGPTTEEPVQQMYQVEHETIGTVDLFLVPIGPDGKGMKYEAVFT